MTTRHTLSFETPQGIDPMRIMAEIASGDEDDSGYVRIDGHSIHWDLMRDGDGVDIDRRQRLASALLLIAFDLPQEMMAAGRTLLEAARICPGMTTGEIGGMGEHQRIRTLERVRSLVDEMIAETKA